MGAADLIDLNEQTVIDNPVGTLLTEMNDRAEESSCEVVSICTKTSN